MHTFKTLKSRHQRKIENFMYLAKQIIPLIPTLPNENIRYLRAKLILEEAIETIIALGFIPECMHCNHQHVTNLQINMKLYDNYPRITEIVDGCCDLSVVTVGTLSAMGIPDKPVFEIVDDNNLQKFGPGHKIDSDGKLIKPPSHHKPDFTEWIRGWVKGE